MNIGQVPDMMCHGQAHAITGQFLQIIHMGRFVILCLVGRLLFLVINAPISKLTQAAAGKPFLLSTYQWHVTEYIRTGRLTLDVIYRRIYCTGAECTKKRKKEKRTDKQATVNQRSKHTMKLLVKLKKNQNLYHQHRHFCLRLPPGKWTEADYTQRKWNSYSVVSGLQNLI